MVLVADDTGDMSILQPAKFDPLVVECPVSSFSIRHGSSDSISALLKPYFRIFPFSQSVITW